MGLHGQLVLGAVLGIAATAACSSPDPSPGGARVKHPLKPAPTAAPSATPSQTPSASPPTAELTPLDLAIYSHCPIQAWSKNVPERSCTKDSECGDGFCDRDRCAPIWTCWETMGQRCVGARQSGGWCSGTCLDGRCRSCLSDDECEKAFHTRGAKCDAAPRKYGDKYAGRGCGMPFDRPFNIPPDNGLPVPKE